MKKLLWLSLLSPALAFSQSYGRVNFTVRTPEGVAIPNAQVTVYAQSACGVAYSGDATLYPSATGGTAITQPLSTDGFGDLTPAAYVAPGCVTIYVNVNYGTLSFTRIYADQVVLLPSSGGSMVYPGAGVPCSTGSSWCTSYAIGTTANDLVQLNSSAQLPAVSAALLTNFPTFNQNTSGLAAGLSGFQTANYIYASPNGSSGLGAWRAMVAADLPGSITSSTSGSAGSLSATLAAASGGSGEGGTLTGPLYGNGTGAYTVATSGQIQTFIGSGVYDASGAAAARAAASTCTAGQYATGTATSATPCAQVNYSELGGTAPAMSNLGGTTTDSLPYQSASATTSYLAPQTTNGVYFLRENVTGSAAVAPSWSNLLPSASGGSGEAGTVTGVLYGNGTSAYTQATAAQLVAGIGSTAVTNATNAANIQLSAVGAGGYSLVLANSGTGNAPLYIPVSGSSFNFDVGFSPAQFILQISATSLAYSVVNSPTFQLNGAIPGLGGSSVTDEWLFQDTPFYTGAANPPSILAITHGGSSGAAYVSLPSLIDTALTASTTTPICVGSSGQLTQSSCTGGSSMMYAGCGLPGTNGTFYCPAGSIISSAFTSVNEAYAEVSQGAATINNLYATVGVDPGNGNTIVITGRVNGSPSSLSCTITGNGSTGTKCPADTTHTMTVTANQTVDWQIVTTGTSYNDYVYINARSVSN